MVDVRQAVELDELPREAFVEAVAPLFEGAPRFLGRLADARPFGSMDRLFQVARSIAHSMPEAEQIELVDAHPPLGAPPGTVSVASFREQGYDPIASPADLDLDLAAELARLNDAYERRFGFRYCTFVAGRSRAELIPEFEAALAAERSSELHRAVDAVIDIACDRHAKSNATEEHRA